MSDTHDPRQPINGFLNLYKPVGITSMDALRRVKRITGQRKKVGHAGTLDPLADGVLPICFGQGTRLMEQVVSGRKRYLMTVKLGATSTTYDAEGTITELADLTGLSQADIAATLVNFVGLIDQVPPMYSAVKVDGRRLYELARSGQEIERKSRQVKVDAIRIDSIALPWVTLTVDCGRGTYLRSIAHDLGAALECGGYVTSLQRQSCGQFNIQESISLENLEQTVIDSGWLEALQPVDWALTHLPSITLNDDAAKAVGNGQPVPAEELGDVGQNAIQLRAYTEDGVFLALLTHNPANGCWQPTKVFHHDSPSPYSPALCLDTGMGYSGPFR